MIIVTNVAKIPAKNENPAHAKECSDPLKNDATEPTNASTSGDPARSIKICDEISHLRLLRRNSSASGEYAAFSAASTNDVFIALKFLPRLYGCGGVCASRP